MGFWIFMLCMNLLLPFIMAVCGWAFRRRPPKQINDLFGYRTARSRSSQEAWDFAQKYMGQLWFRLGIGMAPQPCCPVWGRTQIWWESGAGRCVWQSAL